MNEPYLTAQQAAAELNVSRATLYAYVSRGLVRSVPVDGQRAKLYRADDVRALRRRGGSEDAAADRRQALQFGAPVMESAITLIADGRLFYRGRDAVALAHSASLESVAGLLWQCREDPFRKPHDASADAAWTGSMEGCLAALCRQAEHDIQAYNLEPAGVQATGTRIVRLLVEGFSGRVAAPVPAHRHLADAWTGGGGAELLRAALVLCADHELNASTFTVRCVAATRATPYGAVVAGMAALQGPRHGGMTARAAALLDEVLAAPDALTGLAARLKRGDRLPGFGHPLYPDGDPRAGALLKLAGEHAGGGPEQDRILAVVEAAGRLTGLRPNLDFALVAVARTLALPAHAPMALFAIGRSTGWIAHIIEQYGRPELIRPRARYTGEQPRTGAG